MHALSFISEFSGFRSKSDKQAIPDEKWNAFRSFPRNPSREKGLYWRTALNFSVLDESIKSDMFWWSCKNIKVGRNLEALWKWNSEKKWNIKKKHETSTKLIYEFLIISTVKCVIFEFRVTEINHLKWSYFLPLSLQPIRFQPIWSKILIARILYCMR